MSKEQKGKPNEQRYVFCFDNQYVILARDFTLPTERHVFSGEYPLNTYDDLVGTLVDENGTEFKYRKRATGGLLPLKDGYVWYSFYRAMSSLSHEDRYLIPLAILNIPFIAKSKGDYLKLRRLG